jgi:hypothetical protein
MRKVFNSFYAPTKEEHEALWTEGLIILDANVLLAILGGTAPPLGPIGRYGGGRMRR